MLRNIALGVLLTLPAYLSGCGVGSLAPANAMNMASTLISSGLTITSAQYTGSVSASGIIDFPCGHYLADDQPTRLSATNLAVVLTSGTAAFGLNTYSTSSSATGSNGQPGDSIVSAESGVSTYDASVLTINLVSQITGSLTFDFVFASEEYPEYAGSSFVDAFVLSIDGVNRALVPGTSTPISINTVNAGTRSQYYVAGGAMEYDGSTTLFSSAPVSVTVGQSVTVRFAIADGTDSSYDSAVFIAAGSLKVVQDCNIQLNWNLNGYGINNGTQALVPTPDDCCALCKATLGCVGWSWVSDTYFGPLAKHSCWLRSHIQYEYDEGGVVSGKVVGQCTNCAPMNDECRLEALDYRDNHGALSVDVANCFSPQALAAQLNAHGLSTIGASYGCARSLIPNCNNIVCTTFVPPGAYVSLQLLYCPLQ